MNNYDVRRLAALLCFFFLSLPANAQEASINEQRNTVQSAKEETEHNFSLQDTNNVLFILDVSKSMGESFSGRVTKLSKAKDLIEKTLTSLPPSLACGLRVCGTESEPTRESENTRTLLPMALNQKKKIEAELRTLETAGFTTPLQITFEQVFDKDLASVRGNTAIILLSDGQGTKHSLDAVQAKAKVFPFKILVINLAKAIEDEPVSNQLNELSKKSTFLESRRMHPIDTLKKIASLNGGQYFDCSQLDTYLKVVKTTGSR